MDVTDDALPVLDDVTDDTDPAPLLLVFSDEDCSNVEMRDFYRRVVIDQVRACLLCDLHSHTLGEKYEISPDSLLEKTTDGIFQYLGRERQKKLRRLIRENIFKKITDYRKGREPGVTLVGDYLAFTWSSADEKDDFLNWMEDRRTHFDAGKPPVENQSLFDWADADKREGE